METGVGNLESWNLILIEGQNYEKPSNQSSSFLSILGPATQVCCISYKWKRHPWPPLCLLKSELSLLWCSELLMACFTMYPPSYLSPLLMPSGILHSSLWIGWFLLAVIPWSPSLLDQLLFNPQAPVKCPFLWEAFSGPPSAVTVASFSGFSWLFLCTSVICDFVSYLSALAPSGWTVWSTIIISCHPILYLAWKRPLGMWADKFFPRTLIYDL